MAAPEHDELLALFLAALEAVAPDVTPEERGLVREVVNGMVQERAGPFDEAAPDPPAR